MAAIKSFTSLEQSRKLAEILPLESADMYYHYNEYEERHYPKVFLDYETAEIRQEVLELKRNDPCWSLAALLCVLPKKYYPIKDHETNLILGKPKDKWCVLYWDATGMQDGEQTLGDNAVDACYEMIIKLHEKDLL